MTDDITVTLTYTEEEAREVARTILYFTSNVSATREDHDRMTLVRSVIKGALPPRPEEPLGLGAVVEDAEGARWVRVTGDSHAFSWRPEGSLTDYEDNRYYAKVAAVRTLSEGVTP